MISTSASLNMLKPLTMWLTTNWKILQEMGILNHLICLLRNLYAGQGATVRTGPGTWTGSKLGKECTTAAYCHLAYLIYMQGTSCKMLDWNKHKLESRLLGKISITSDMLMILPMAEAKRNKRAS